MGGSGQIRGTLTLQTFVLISCIALSNSLPVEQPTKFSLTTVQESPLDSVTNPVSRLDQGKQFMSESQYAPSVIIKNPGIPSEDEPHQPIQDRPGLNLLGETRETVRLENEGAQSLFERPLSKSIGGALENFFKPTPLVDRIREEEKYGNSGDKFIGIGRALVGGFEGLSNFLNNIIEIPRSKIKGTSRGLTEALNHVGARIVGLE